MREKVGAKVMTTQDHGGARKGETGVVMGVHTGSYYAVDFNGHTAFVPDECCEPAPAGGVNAGRANDWLAAVFERPLSPSEWQRTMDWLLENCPL